MTPKRRRTRARSGSIPGMKLAHAIAFIHIAVAESSTKERPMQVNLTIDAAVFVPNKRRLGHV